MLRKDAANTGESGDTFNGTDERGGSHVDTVLLGGGIEIVEGLLQDVAESLIDLVFGPRECLEALHPL
ncbi:MAG: hypothetical protein ACKOCK_08635 [Chloroflexota bacterium]